MTSINHPAPEESYDTAGHGAIIMKGGGTHTWQRLTNIMIALGLAWLLTGCGSPMAGHTSPCALYSRGATEACYAPSQSGAAEARLAVVRINPSVALYRVARLQLTNLIVWQRNFHPSLTIGIDYIFGKIPLSEDGSIPRPAPRYPKFGVVSESAMASPSGP